MDRFKDLSWFKHARNRVITVIGNGGINSWTNVLLARAGLRPMIIDYDDIDNTNISGQMFFKEQIGMSKIMATRNIIHSFGGDLCNPINIKFNKTHSKYLREITIIGTDNMKSRIIAWELWYKKFVKNKGFESNMLFIDARLSAESFQIFCITNEKDAKTYKANYLYSGNDIEEISCTAKQTSHYAAIIAGNIVRFVTNNIANELGETRYVPFIYDIAGIFGDDFNIVDKNNLNT